MIKVSMIASNQSVARRATTLLKAEGWNARPSVRLASALITIDCDEDDRSRALAAIHEADPGALPNGS
jgi:hypothetical protein